MLLEVAGTGIVLTGNPVVVGVEPVGIRLRSAVAKEEELSHPLRAEVRAVPVRGHRGCWGEGDCAENAGERNQRGERSSDR